MTCGAIKIDRDKRMEKEIILEEEMMEVSQCHEEKSTYKFKKLVNPKTLNTKRTTCYNQTVDYLR